MEYIARYILGLVLLLAMLGPVIGGAILAGHLTHWAVGVLVGSALYVCLYVGLNGPGLR